MKKTKILIIDDSASLRASLRDMLPSSTEVIEATNGIEGLQQVQANPPNLILLDCQMPQMDGVEVYRRLQNHARFRRIPVVLMSACRDEVIPLLNRLPMEYEFLSKPFNAEQLLRSSHGAMKRARQLPEATAQKAYSQPAASQPAASQPAASQQGAQEEAPQKVAPPQVLPQPVAAPVALQAKTAEPDSVWSAQRLQDEVQRLQNQNEYLQQEMQQMRQQLRQVVTALRSPTAVAKG